VKNNKQLKFYLRLLIGIFLFGVFCVISIDSYYLLFTDWSLGEFFIDIGTFLVLFTAIIVPTYLVIRKGLTKIQASAKHYRELSDTLPEIIFEADTEGNLTYTNAAAFKDFGYTEDDFAEGLNILKMTTDELTTFEDTRTLLKGDTPELTREYAAKRKDGTTFPVLVSATPIFKEGGVVGIRGVITDITLQKQSEAKIRESEEKYRALYESSVDGIVSVSMDGFVTEANKAYLDMLGYTPEEVKRLPYKQLAPEKWHSIEEEIVESQILVRGYSDEYKKEYIRKDGTVFPVSLRAWLIKDELGNPVGMWAFVRDITDRRKSEELVEAHAEELSEIVSVAAHELRHPATIFKGYSEILLNSGGNLEKEAVVEALEGISKASDRLVEIATKLQDTSEIKDGIKLHRRSTDPALLIKKAIGLLDAENSQFELDFPDNLLPVYVDSDKITQALLALLENAVKFSPEESTINLSIKQNEEETVFSVSDRGKGIPEESLELVFDKFHQVEDSIHHSKYGMGFGLYIVKSIIEAHGGWVKAGTREGGGSVLTFGIPAKKELVVLIVDDDPDIVQLISMQVALKGHKTLSALGGEEGVKVAREELPDVILLDLMMPEFDGFAVLKALKVYEETKDIPVIAVTAKADEESAKEVLELGAVECVTKPYDFAEILKLIESVT